MSIVVAIAVSNEIPWSTIKVGQQETWIKRIKNDELIISYLSKKSPKLISTFEYFIEKNRFSIKYGKYISKLNQFLGLFVSRKIPKYTYLKNLNELHVNSWSTHHLFGRRNLALFDWFINSTSADFLFQTNVSSYVHIERLQDLIVNLNSKKNIYAGVIINPHELNFPIVSGAGKLLSRSLVLEILMNKNLLKFNNLEDVTLAELINTLNVKAIDLPRLDLPNLIAVNEVPAEDLAKHFHFRCKSNETPRKDVEIMKSLDSRLFKKIDKTDI